MIPQLSRVYRPREDFVLFALVDKGMMGSLIAPGISAQGKERIVVAVGPKVEDLKVGDKIFVIGAVGESVIELPFEQSVYMTRQANVCLIVEEHPE